MLAIKVTIAKEGFLVSNKIVISLSNGERVWLNLMQMVKMVKTPEGRFLLFMTNGEMYEIDFQTARIVENCLEGR